MKGSNVGKTVHFYGRSSKEAWVFARKAGVRKSARMPQLHFLPYNGRCLVLRVQEDSGQPDIIGIVRLVFVCTADLPVPCRVAARVTRAAEA